MCRVPTMQNRFGKFDGLFTKKLFYHQGFFAVKRRVVFILGAKWIHVAPRLFFMFFVFDSIDDSAKLPIWRNLSNFVAKIHNHEFKLMKIGQIDLGNRPVMLAPMEDVTDLSFRQICREQGADMVYTEFVSADALIRNIQATLRKLNISDAERPAPFKSMVVRWSQWWKPRRCAPR